MIDEATVHFLSKRGLHIPNWKLERMKAEMDALWESYQEELKFIEELPKDLQYLYAKYRR